eukprot:TRINITY_DN3527_c0_g1_i1.p1 TRINITY_DN3527_c0_g1~~TRINITY_DN3527_c0_g1_i1.p1  ORF type:complete len:627 (+),score=171.04 TRINITY_DN3527_c0_g1_i1:147-2027(+)
MIRRPPRSTLSSSSAASDVYKRQVLTMELHKDNFEAELPALLEHIGSAQFIAIDFEMTGLYTSFRKSVGEQEAYSWHREHVSNFLPIQLGLCTVSARPPGHPLGPGWLLRPYTMDIFPSAARCFCSSTQTLEFLRRNRFDLNRWTDMAVRYARKDDTVALAEYHRAIAAARRFGRSEPEGEAVVVHKKEDKSFVERTLQRVGDWVITPIPQPLVLREGNSYRRKLILQEVGRAFPDLVCVVVPTKIRSNGKAENTLQVLVFLNSEDAGQHLLQLEADAGKLLAEAEGATRVVDALLRRRGKAQLLVHNGVFDLLHLYNAFVGELPEYVEAFKQEWALRCPDVMDTKWLCEMVPEITKAATVHDKFSSTLLPALIAIHGTRVDNKIQMPVDLAHGYSTRFQMACGGKDAVGFEHEAGYDAMMTAQLFLEQLALVSGEVCCQFELGERDPIWLHHNLALGLNCWFLMATVPRTLRIEPGMKLDPQELGHLGQYFHATGIPAGTSRKLLEASANQPISVWFLGEGDDHAWVRVTSSAAKQGKGMALARKKKAHPEMESLAFESYQNFTERRDAHLLAEYQQKYQGAGEEGARQPVESQRKRPIAEEAPLAPAEKKVRLEQKGPFVVAEW